MSNTAVVARAPAVSWCDLGDEIVVLRVRDRAYYRLRTTARAVWLCLERPRSMTDLLTVMQEKFEGDTETISSELRGFLERCRDLDLVTVGPLSD